jgi:flagellar basal-body rod protein FlgB
MLNADLAASLLDACALRQKVIANNIANFNTPGYRRAEVRFEEMLTRALQNGGDEAVQRVRPEIVVPRTTRVRPDGNDVDLNREIGEQATNALFYRAVLEILDARVRTLRTAIGGK